MFATAVREAWYGRPGVAYLDLPSDVLGSSIAGEPAIEPVPPPPRAAGDPTLVERAVSVLARAKKPLLVIGKGASWSDASPQLTRLVEQTGLPFIPTPMGKGVLPDGHARCASAARATALKEADVLLLAGARMNWMLHLGAPPRLRPDLEVIQIDIMAEELGRNIPAHVGIVGDLRQVLEQMLQHEQIRDVHAPAGWIQELDQGTAEKRKMLEAELHSEQIPMGYYRPLFEISKVLPKDTIVVADGAKTMDISRVVLGSSSPRHRLDAGSWGTMGVGLGFAIAAQVVHPEKQVVAILGDGAFGFDGMEIEVAVRYRLPILFIVFVNNGIGNGVARLPESGPPPVHVYTPGARHDRMMEAFGARGYHCESPDQLGQALERAMAAREPALINVQIAPEAPRAKQSFSRGWLARY